MESMKITLRAPEPSDVDAMFRMENDPAVWPDGHTRAPLSRHLLAAYVDDYTPDAFAQGQLRLMIDCDGETCGMVDLYDVDALNRRAGVGIVVETAMRGRGIGRRALEILTDYCSCQLGLHQLYAVVSAGNTASRVLFDHVGYKIAGCLRSWVRCGGRYSDAYVYQLMLPGSC